MPFRRRNVDGRFYTTDSVGNRYTVDSARNPYTVGAKYKFNKPYDKLLQSDIFENTKDKTLPFKPIPANTPCTIIEVLEGKKISYIDCSFYLESEVYTLFMLDPNAFLIPDTAGGRRRRRRTRRMRRSLKRRSSHR